MNNAIPFTDVSIKNFFDRYKTKFKATADPGVKQKKSTLQGQWVNNKDQNDEHQVALILERDIN
ncbi:hypothetical protein MUN89_17840 [Halobacillus salinarum]|uniref:Uncharacterized protein n=1 Tax=Halobacillus salinarum TaxID=2932257 RepID=A0ABY4EH07_9BACI|nr:hypothetical protein [Halobacillus salinarum]UOQ43725.1 hypothetical protein MUN89_17840 [Halobacillus salinarum]